MLVRLKYKAPEVLCVFSVFAQKYNKELLVLMIAVFLLADGYPQSPGQPGMNPDTLYPQVTEPAQQKKKDWKEDVQWGL